MNKVCTKISLSIIGKLNSKRLINLALNTNCKNIEIEKKISGKKDFKTLASINFNFLIL